MNWTSKVLTTFGGLVTKDGPTEYDMGDVVEFDGNEYIVAGVAAKGGRLQTSRFFWSDSEWRSKERETEFVRDVAMVSLKMVSGDGIRNRMMSTRVLDEKLA